jgi:hypothetical protein
VIDRGEIFLAPVLLAAAISTHTELINEVVRVPAGDWRYVEVALKQRPAFVSADYQVERGSPEVRLALMRREDLDRLRNDLPEGALTVTATAAFGRLRYRVPLRGVYAILIDNRAGSRPAAVRLRAALDFGPIPGPEITLLSPGRQFAVIAISFAVFFAIVTYSARRLLRGIRH